MNKSAAAAVPVFTSGPSKKQIKGMGQLAGAIVAGQAWSAELTHVRTTHGPMDVRIWRKVK